MNTYKIINFLNSYLSIHEYDDTSLNGVQVEGKSNTKKILFAVTYSKEIGEYASKNEFDMIITHHGIFWGKIQPIKGIFKERIKPLIENNINLLTYHIPLDAHPKIGNNISIIKLLKCEKAIPFANYKGRKIGFIGIYKKPKKLIEIEEIIKTKINHKILHLKFGKPNINKIAVLSGEGSAYIEEALNAGVDLYITGEIPQYIYPITKESKLNLIIAGHTQTEVFGLQNLKKLISKKFKIYSEFYKELF
ncbi:MAG: Nif3-like dinuclear metal center hexameric protein [Endomicrobia bacterium]|nr:Nif3-like dinuclear metal center hexameric protein [Endomicrobiia bacterium]